MTSLPAGTPQMPAAPPPRGGPDRPAAGRPRSAGARTLRERLVFGVLLLCGFFSVGTMLMILFILLTNTADFFGHPIRDVAGNEVTVTPGEFLGGGEWNPLLGAEKHFGVWPLVVGTLQVAVVAMAFALPLGLMVAIWLSEYARPRLRAVVKPVLETIAGVPTVVFGFFALTFLTPLLRFSWWPSWMPFGGSEREGAVWNPFDIGTYNVLAAGLAVGIMCLPIVTSLAEDALRAVPRQLREGSYGLGASRFETSLRVVLPAALSGVIAAFLLAVARAVGETMIVALAAGSLPPNLHEDPMSALDLTGDTQTMTGYIVQIFLGDVEHGGVEYLSVYAIAFTLFVMTLLLTLGGGAIRARYRQVYD